MAHKGSSGVAGVKRVVRETNTGVLRQALLRRLPNRLRGSGEFSIPPVAGLLDHYTQLFMGIFAAIGRVFTAQEIDVFRAGLKKNLDQAWAISPYSKVLVSYETDTPPKTGLLWRINVVRSTVADEYDHWLKTRTPPLFGKHPDAKIFELARALGAPEEVPILDVGAGTGRNTLALARAGFPTDAVEMVPSLAAVLREEAEKESLPLRVFEGDMFDASLGIPAEHYRILLLAEVVASHFRTEAELHALFELSSRLLPPGGLLVFSAFLASDGYKPDDAAREMSQVQWCNLFTRRQLQDAMGELPFKQLSDESVQAYEKAHLAADEWPPTGWFETWTGGQDLFDLPPGKPPMDLRWLVYRKA